MSIEVNFMHLILCSDKLLRALQLNVKDLGGFNQCLVQIKVWRWCWTEHQKFAKTNVFTWNLHEKWGILFFGFHGNEKEHNFLSSYDCKLLYVKWCECDIYVSVYFSALANHVGSDQAAPNAAAWSRSILLAYRI